MKTAVIMKRELLGMVIRQDSKTGMLNANDLHAIGNIVRKAAGLPEKQLAAYFNLGSTEELIDQLQMGEGLSVDGIKVSRRGKEGGTWVNPILFIDMAMWYSPELKVKIIKWAMDGLIMRRNESGDSFKNAMEALTVNHPRFFEKTSNYANVCSLISAACKVGAGADKWQEASESQLAMRDRIHNNIVLLADVMPSVPDCVNAAIEKAKKALIPKVV